MNAKEIIQKIKAAFEDVTAPAVPVPVPAIPVPVEFKEYTLEDGSAIKIDKLEVGGAVMIGDMPAPAAEYKLADGSSLTVDEMGMILELKPKEAAVPAAVPAVPAAAEDMRIPQLMAEQAKMKTSFSALLSLVETLIDTPAADPLELQRGVFGEMKKDKADKYAELASTLKSLKK